MLPFRNRELQGQIYDEVSMKYYVLDKRQPPSHINSTRPISRKSNE